jgi:NAD(P)-dependent dehydrogenase (short-subunit alcohol dehydrogenase family)
LTYLPPGSLSLVTGAGSGIGRATAWELARRGARVLCVDLDGDAARRTAGRIGGAAHQVDVSDADGMAALAKQVHAEHGPLDVLVNNAGVGMSGRFLATTLDDWRWILGVNLLGVIHGCRAFGPMMVKRGQGHVINVASGLAFTSRATEPAYVTTKAGVLALSRCLRADWGRRGVLVSVVFPGVTDTSIVRHSRFRGDRASPQVRRRAERFFSRWGRPPEAVGRAIVDVIGRDRPVVPVGLETWIGWYANRLLPVRVADRLASGASLV